MEKSPERESVAPEEDYEPVRAKRVRRRWKLHFLRLLLILGIIAVGLVLTGLRLERNGKRDLEQAVAEMDQKDPSWRFEALVAERLARPSPPQSVVKSVLEIQEEIPKPCRKWLLVAKWVSSSGDNKLPTPQRVAELRQYEHSTRVLRERALTLSELPSGIFPFHVTDDPQDFSLPHLERAEKVVRFLEYDARLAAVNSDSNRGIGVSRSIVSVARAIGDEPAAASQEYRMLFLSRAASVALATLAMGAPTKGLAELQQVFLDEADKRPLLDASRGERAFHHQVFSALESGRLKPEQLLEGTDLGDSPLVNPAVFELYQALLPGDQAECLRLDTAFMEALKLPWDAQRDAVAAILAEVQKQGDLRHPLARYVFARNRLVYLHQFSLRNRARLLMAAVAIACERFRQQHRRWPRELAELTLTLLPALPENPVNREPLRYEVLADRIVLSWYFWAEGEANREPVEFRQQQSGPVEFHRGPEAGAGIGVSLWNPQLRGLPPGEKGKP